MVIYVKFISYLLNLVRAKNCSASDAISAQIFKLLAAIPTTLQTNKQIDWRTKIEKFNLKKPIILK